MNESISAASRSIISAGVMSSSVASTTTCALRSRTSKTANVSVDWLSWNRLASYSKPYPNVVLRQDDPPRSNAGELLLGVGAGVAGAGLPVVGVAGAPEARG